MIFKFLLLFLSVQLVRPTPVFIRSGLAFAQDKGSAQNSDLFDKSGTRASNSLEEAEGYNKDDRHKSVDSADSSKFGQSSAAQSSNSNQDQFKEDKFNQDAERQEHEVKKNSNHNKGHRKSGFHNSYHKDESGSNSSYFEDAGDEGNRYVYDGRRKKYDGTGASQREGLNYDQNNYDRNQAQHRNYDRRGNIYNDMGDRGYYNQRRDHGDRELYAKNSANNRYNEGGASHRDDYRNGPRPHYTNVYDPYYDRYPRTRYYGEDDARIQTTPLGHTVKIYEDPRYVNNGHQMYSRNHPGYYPSRYDYYK